MSGPSSSPGEHRQTAHLRGGRGGLAQRALSGRRPRTRPPRGRRQAARERERRIADRTARRREHERTGYAGTVRERAVCSTHRAWLARPAQRAGASAMAERSLNHEIEQVSPALAEHGLTRRDESRAKTLPDDLNSPAGRPPATAKDPEGPRGHEMTEATGDDLTGVRRCAHGHRFQHGGRNAGAYVSRRLSRGQVRGARRARDRRRRAGGVAVGPVRLVVGRVHRPGTAGQEIADGLPGIVRVAAVASALFLVWRLRRVPR